MLKEITTIGGGPANPLHGSGWTTLPWGDVVRNPEAPPPSDPLAELNKTITEQNEIIANLNRLLTQERIRAKVLESRIFELELEREG